MDLAAISKSAAESAITEASFVLGRVLQYDADFGCYECAWLDKSVADNIDTLMKHIDIKRQMAGAEYVNVHITLGMKGGREQMATVKPYQEQRGKRDPLLTERVAALRNFLANYDTDIVTPVANLLQEADDSLTQLQVLRIRDYGVQSSVIMSGDKDLWMVDGLHCDQKTGRMYTVKGYGKTEYRDVGNVKPKLIGEGTSWFWHQMLHGDTADNIAGLPTLTAKLLNRYLPTKKFNPKRKDAPCGEAKSTAILNGVTNDVEACKRVLEAYSGIYPNAKTMMIESAFLLWMRRTENPKDCVDFLNESGLHCAMSINQNLRLKEFDRLSAIQIEASNE